MPSLSIRPFSEGDDLALGEILHDAATPAEHVARNLFRPDGEQPLTRAVVATIDNTEVVVGAAAIAESPAHPHRAWVHVEVATEDRRRGVGRALLDAVRERVAGTSLEGLPLRARVSPGSDGQAAARAAGFHDLFRTRVVRVEPGTLAGLGAGREADFTVTATGSVVLTQLFGEWYAGVNRVDPAAEMSVGAVNRRFLSEQTGAHGAAILRRDGVPAGFAVSYAEPYTVDEESAPSEEDEYPATELTLASLFDARRPGAAGAGAIDRESPEFQKALGDAAVLLASLSLETPVVVEVTSEMPVVTELVDGLLESGQASVLYEYATLALD